MYVIYRTGIEFSQSDGLSSRRWDPRWIGICKRGTAKYSGLNWVLRTKHQSNEKLKKGYAIQAKLITLIVNSSLNFD